MSEASVVSRAARADHKCPVIMEFENGSFRSLGGSRPVRLAGYINQDETAILCGVWEFVGQEPNNSVYLAPIGFADVVLSSILLLISYHTPILLGDFHFYIIKTPKSYARIVENSPLIWSFA